MSEICKNIEKIKVKLHDNIKLLAVSKTKSIDDILETYKCGQLDFGENKVQELTTKYESLPKNIHWHFIGHLQSNKVKYIAPFIYLIHSVDSLKILKEINKQAIKNNRIIDVLLQLHIGQEESKFGFSNSEIFLLFENEQFKNLKNIRICGLMGMATNTSDEKIILQEFNVLTDVFKILQTKYFKNKSFFQIKSFGMSNDYELAIDSGSNLVRLGSSIFGKR
ncbi:MAG: YggS family pyridoxal phosphate-dependent enzyme [Putridiphycobacter sp.]